MWAGGFGGGAKRWRGRADRADLEAGGAVGMVVGRGCERGRPVALSTENREVRAGIRSAFLVDSPSPKIGAADCPAPVTTRDISLVTG